MSGAAPAPTPTPAAYKAQLQTQVAQLQLAVARLNALLVAGEIDPKSQDAIASAILTIANQANKLSFPHNLPGTFPIVLG